MSARPFLMCFLHGWEGYGDCPVCRKEQAQSELERSIRDYKRGLTDLPPGYYRTLDQLEEELGGVDFCMGVMRVSQSQWESVRAATVEYILADPLLQRGKR